MDVTLLGAVSVASASSGSSASAEQPTCYSALVNDWFCKDYYIDRQDELIAATREHLFITVCAVVLGFLVAMPLALLARRSARVEAVVLALSTSVYTIPSLALFPLIVPFTGLSRTTVIIGLALYSLTILVRNTTEGLRGVPDDVVESATGLGYSPRRLLWRIELPLALPVIMAGLRIATVSTVALTTVGALVAYGGLGNLLYNGVRTEFRAQVMAASLICVAIAVLLDLLLLGVQKGLTPWTWGVRSRG
ncbi:ABC transporter permease [Nocardioides guangzhouensis]|uniref:ABC transporter permease n=1 Tax=Nocardioides guangzhouensis TaxID=2497878 RepID=A0A4Q4ZIH0_9ACTN|nr:ABC transporter permease [Nocardioides guangzhouensis]